jgi:hypothetical protein
MNFSFSLGVRRFSEKTIRAHEYVRRGVILKLFSSIIKDTPVLTGALRANWICSVGNPDISTDHGKETAAAIALLTSTTLASQPGDTVILTNRLPYVGRIEYEGWSHTKAPAGMVRRNVTRFRQLISQQLHTVE